MHSENDSAKSRSDEIYKYLKNAIIKNEIKPNEQINTKQITKIFKTSRTPVRDAVMRLISENFLEFNSSRAVVVKEVSFDDFLEACETIIVLDFYACQRAIDDMSDQDLQTLIDLTSEMEKYSNIDTFNEFLDKSTQIHMFIWGSLKNKYFLSTIAGIHDNMLQAYRRAFDIQWTSARSFKTYFKKSMKNHKIIAEKISKRNRTGLKNAIKNHWMALAK